MAETVCDACKLPPPDADAVRVAEGALAPGWVVRRIDGRTFTLCDCCGSIRQFKGGVSAYLQKTLGVSEYAEIEFDDVPGGGLHRQRLKRRQWTDAT